MAQENLTSAHSNVINTTDNIANKHISNIAIVNNHNVKVDANNPTNIYAMHNNSAEYPTG